MLAVEVIAGRGSSKSLETTAYEWSRPSFAVGENRTRTISGLTTEIATTACRFVNVTVFPWRAGAGTSPIEAHCATADPEMRS
jgi:hypothetical protein